MRFRHIRSDMRTPGRMARANRRHGGNPGNCSANQCKVAAVFIRKYFMRFRPEYTVTRLGVFRKTTTLD